MHWVNVITFDLDLSEHNRRLLLYEDDHLF